MKTKNVKLKFKDLRTNQKVFISDGKLIFPMVVGSKYMDNRHYQTLHHSSINTPIKLPYSDSKISTYEGDRAVDLLSRLNINISVSDTDIVHLVNHDYYLDGRIFYTRLIGKPQEIKIRLDESHFMNENTQLRIFRKLPQAIRFCKLGLNEYTDDMDTILLGHAKDILHFNPKRSI